MTAEAHIKFHRYQPKEKSETLYVRKTKQSKTQVYNFSSVYLWNTFLESTFFSTLYTNNYLSNPCNSEALIMLTI